MTQYLYGSKIWMDYLDNHFDECADFFKFAMVWMSFNSYCSLRYKHIKGELNQITEFIKDNKEIYWELENDGFKNVLLDDFKNTGWLFSQSGKRDCVADARENSDKKYFFNEANHSCEDFFKIVYQIRCNFFHGNKDVSDDGNKKIIQWAYKYLNIFWKNFLSKNSY